MIKYVCIEDHSILKKDNLYYIDHNVPDNVLNVLTAHLDYIDRQFHQSTLDYNYIEIYDMDCSYLGGWWLDLNKHFKALADIREQQINEILDL